MATIPTSKTTTTTSNVSICRNANCSLGQHIFEFIPPFSAEAQRRIRYFQSNFSSYLAIEIATVAVLKFFVFLKISLMFLEAKKIKYFEKFFFLVVCGSKFAGFPK